MSAMDKRLLVALVFFFGGSLSFSNLVIGERLPDRNATPLILDVVYPRLEGQDTVITLPRVDSTFAFGSVQPADGGVFVNGIAARIWGNGAFLAYFPLDTAAWRFNFLAVSPTGDSLQKDLAFRFAPAAVPVVDSAEAALQNRSLASRITIADPRAHLRSMPNGAYVMAPPAGSVAWADSFSAPYYRLRLGENRHAWIEASAVRLDSSNGSPPHASVSRISTRSEAEWSYVEIPLAEPLLFDVVAEPEDRRLFLDLFGAHSRINRMDYHSPELPIREIRWKQLNDEVLRLEILLNCTHQWGYSATWGGRDGKTLILKIRRPPQIERRVLKGRRIVLDPGHGGMQTGAIGPTRLVEKAPNLKLALMLKKLLEKEGALVFLTRSSDSTIDLYDRVDYALQQEGEILVSLHNNALSDGENPFVKHGSAAYYYHPQSLQLTRMLHESLLEATRLPDYGLYYQNLALARPTEMPAVLLESAFMMYPEEEALLKDDRFLRRTASGIAAGLKHYLKECREYP